MIKFVKKYRKIINTTNEIYVINILKFNLTRIQ